MISAYLFVSISASIIHVKLARGWALSRVNFDPIERIGLKVVGRGPFQGWVLFYETCVGCGYC